MSDEESLEALRRRVYGPNASDADREAYTALLERSSTASPVELDQRTPEPAEGPASPRPGRRSRWPIVIGVAGVLLVVGLGAVSTAIARTSTTPRPPTRQADAPWSGTAVPTAGPLLTPATITVHRTTIAAQTTAGGGSATMPLDLSGAPRDGGTLIVSLVSSDPSPIGWLAERHPEGSHADASLQLVAAERPSLRDGTTTPTVVRYTGAPPSQITVRAPVGTGWTLTVAMER